MAVFQSIDEWTTEDVTSWLAATSSYEFANMFIESKIDGPKLASITDESLFNMGIRDCEHRQLLLFALQELLAGNSELVSNIPCLHRVLVK